MSTLSTRPVRGGLAVHPVRHVSTHSLLLVSGMFASLLYVGMNVFIPLQWAGYSFASQTISELSAIGAPTRPLWVALGRVFDMLYIAFGFGVLLAAGGGRRLRWAGVFIITHGVLGFFWPPMHLRGAEVTLTDTLHVVWTALTVLLMTLAIAFAAGAFGGPFRVFSFVTLVIMIGFGVLAGLNGPRVAANLPTPWVGVWERINAAAFVVWLGAFAILLLRDPVRRTSSRTRVAREA